MNCEKSLWLFLQEKNYKNQYDGLCNVCRSSKLDCCVAHANQKRTGYCSGKLSNTAKKEYQIIIPK